VDHHRWNIALLASLSATLVAAGCATVKAADARAGDLRAWFQDHPFSRECDGLWPAALKVVEARGYPLSSSDGEIVGQVGAGQLAQFVSAGTKTYRTQDGGLTTSTDWNRESGTRIRLTATPAGPSACGVRFDVIGGGLAGSEALELGPDWELDLDLLRVLDPAVATKLEAGLPPGP